MDTFIPFLTVFVSQGKSMTDPPIPFPRSSQKYPSLLAFIINSLTSSHALEHAEFSISLSLSSLRFPVASSWETSSHFHLTTCSIRGPCSHTILCTHPVHHTTHYPLIFASQSNCRLLSLPLHYKYLKGGVPSSFKILHFSMTQFSHL